MTNTSGGFILGLSAAVVACAGMVLRLLRVDHLVPVPEGGAPLLFPREQEAAWWLATQPTLVELAAAQNRLRALVPADAAGQDAIWLGTFVRELCAILQTVEQSTIQLSGPSPVLDWLLFEVQAVEQTVGARGLQPYAGDDVASEQNRLAGRLTTIRMCAHELAAPLVPRHR